MNIKKKKGFTLVEIMIVVVIIGLLAAMAIPAFQKVREQSRQKTIVNNLRNVASVGAQYILETGAETVAYQTLIDNNYLPTIQIVAGESYDVTVDQDGGTIMATAAGGQTVVFTY